MFPAIVAAWLLPDDSPFIWPAMAAILWGFLIGGLGAIQGILFACGRLHFGCPICDARSPVAGAHRYGTIIQCPRCGPLQLRLDRLCRLRAIRPGSEEDDVAGYPASTGSLLLAPRRHWISFSLIFAPVVASIVVASILHEFMIFYILIPGFWCYGVGGIILDGIFSGSTSDSNGRLVRRRNPIRFWREIAILSLFYLLAAAFPIAFALQERGKKEAAATTDSSPTVHGAPDSKP